MEDLLGLLKRKPKTPASSPSQPPPSSSEEELKLKLCKLIIERYRDKIEEYETKSVSDLKGMIQPKDPAVAELKSSIVESFHPYVYSEHFLECAKMAFRHLSSFKTISAPVSFWLSFSEMKELMAGDEIDKSIFLCSVLRSLGSENAKVFVTDTRNSYVLFQFGGKSFVADHSKDELQEYASGQEAMDSLKGKILYAFNDLTYEDFQDSGQIF
ncbi:MAG: hypothetical protein QW275_03280 [Candidatus Anstonellaceae archaeon]